MPKRRENLNDRDKLILDFMEEERGLYISSMASYTGLTEAEVRRSYRKLRRMGLAIFMPLWNEDEGCPAGSGYVLSPEGCKAQEALHKGEENKGY